MGQSVWICYSYSMFYFQMHIKCSMKECREVKKIPSRYVYILVQNVLIWNVNHWKSLEEVFLYFEKWYQIATTLQYFWIYSLLPAGLFKLWNNLVIEQWNCQKREYRSFEDGRRKWKPTAPSFFRFCWFESPSYKQQIVLA